MPDSVSRSRGSHPLPLLVAPLVSAIPLARPLCSGLLCATAGAPVARGTAATNAASPVMEPRRHRCLRCRLPCSGNDARGRAQCMNRCIVLCRVLQAGSADTAPWHQSEGRGTQHRALRHWRVPSSPARCRVAARQNQQRRQSQLCAPHPVPLPPLGHHWRLACRWRTATGNVIAPPMP